MIAAPDLSAIQLHVPLPVMHRVRHAARFAPDHDAVIGPKGESMIGRGRLGREQQQAPGRGRVLLPPLLIGGPRGVASQIDGIEIVHPGPLHAPVVENEAAGENHVDTQVPAGCEAQKRAGILRNVRLE